MPVNAETAAFLAAIDENLKNFDAVVDGLSKEQFNWRPEAGRWSVGENVAHLCLTDGRDLDYMASVIARAHADEITGRGPFRYGPLSTRFAASQDIPVKQKAKAPKVFQPPSDVEPAIAIAEYRRIGAELRRIVEASDGLDLSLVLVELSALPALLRAIVRMPLGARFQLLVNHARKHIWQAGEVRKSNGFPR